MENQAWNLEDFIDSLVVELDKTRETLAIKAINKQISYTVKDMAMDVNIFPSYDGDQIKFVTAQPGQQGASKVTIQLGSITDQQVRATSKITGLKDDKRIEDISIDKKTKKQLRKIGVTSVDDLKQIERKEVDIKKVNTENSDIDYVKLANEIQKSKRNDMPPKVNAVSLSVDEDKNSYLILQGQHLSINPKFNSVAIINDKLAEVTTQSENELKIKLHKDHNLNKNNNVVITFDPFSVVKLNINL